MEFLLYSGAVSTPLVGLAALGLLLCRRGRGCRWLIASLAITLFCLVLLFGGESLLAQFHLAWRSWLSLLLGYCVLSGAIAAEVSSLQIFWAAPLSSLAPRLWAALRVLLSILTLLSLSALFIWGNFFLLFGHEPETIQTVDGQRVVQSDQGFLDYHMVYYPYRGPLVRGTEVLWDEGGR